MKDNASLEERVSYFSKSWVDKASIDLVPCLHLDSWAIVAQEWITRNRIWPQQVVVDTIVSKGMHLVNKPLCHKDIDWRLSFSIGEVILANLWTDWQRYISVIFKSLFCKFVKSVELDYNLKRQSSADRVADSKPKKYVTSYNVKTIMI